MIDVKKINSLILPFFYRFKYQYLNPLSLNFIINRNVIRDKVHLNFFDDREYLHKGIAERNFTRTFKLAEYVEVKTAKLEDGILRVTLHRNIPDAMKPQKIDIS